jgi:hypothetical protein
MLFDPDAIAAIDIQTMHNAQVTKFHASLVSSSSHFHNFSPTAGSSAVSGVFPSLAHEIKN